MLKTEQFNDTSIHAFVPAKDGLAALYNGKVQLDYWPGERWARGSYSYWAVGQDTRFAGCEGQREGRCHFAGEHTSIDSQGYLNGAVETGKRAAQEILAMRYRRGRTWRMERAATIKRTAARQGGYPISIRNSSMRCESCALVIS